jgi:hypothetical protein
MSRFGDDGDPPEYANASDLWEANVRRALAGKRGKKALAELREALRALPEKRLISGALCTVGGMDRPDAPSPPRDDDRWPGGGWAREELAIKLEEEGQGVCAIGAFLWHKKVKAGADPRAAFEELPMLLDSEHDGWETAIEGKKAGLTYTLASSLAYQNDESYGGMTPEERYTAFMAWLDEQLVEVPA